MRFRMIIAACIVILFGAVSDAAVPTSITVQGKLTDTSGTPFAESIKGFEFRIFDDELGGVQVWPTLGFEVQNITTDASGLWSTDVGRFVSLTESVFSDTIRWLQITVDGTTLPRVRLVTGPFAYRVATVDGASGGTITSKVSIGPGHTNTGASAFVAGENNVVSGDRSTVSGGDGNSATATNATVGGGRGNVASAEASAIGGGISNEAGFICATVSGGYNCVASNQFATVGGGYADTASGLVATVAGGNRNMASGQGATVAGGDRNTASGQVSAIGGGNANSASGIGSTSGGGVSNQAGSDYATVSGGFNSIASNQFSTVGGGYEDTASGSRATVGGGQWNVASGDWSTVGGGGANYASNHVATVAGGNRSIASGQGSTVGGGEFNRARGSHSVVAGGGGSTDVDSNSASGNGSTVSGGKGNVASGLGSTVAGGEANRAIGQHSTVSGGGSSFDANSNTAESDYSSVGGGRSNLADGPFSTIAGGAFNRASGSSAIVGGGSNNIATGELSTSAGGLANFATAYAATVAGGELNRANAIDASVGGGNANVASGLSSTIPGGRSNSATGDYAFAAGRRAKSLHAGSFVWGDSTDSDFASTADNQFLIRAGGGVGIGTNSPEAPFHISEGSAGATTAHANAIAAFERNGNAYLQLLTPDANENGLLFGTPAASVGGAVLFNTASVPNGLEFRTNSNDFAVAINAAGNVGISTSAPYTSLSVDGTIGFKNGSGIEMYMFESGTANADRMIIAHSPSAPTYGLEYQDVGDKFAFVGNGLPAMTVDLSGTGGFVGFGSVTSPSNIITLPNSNSTSGRALGFAWDVYSSQRWKDSIETLTNALGLVESLRGVRYTWKSDGSHDIGLIAEEVGKVIPEVVQFEENGVDAKSVDYARLVALLIEGMKEQQLQIDDLRKRLDRQSP